MGTILWITIILVALYIIFYFLKIRKIKEERKRRDEADRQGNEQTMSPRKKLHEEEKKRWEDEYWRRQARGER
ncbi:MAG: hypothetical protein NTU54_08310 [Candidatus Omnitrophica bacterium]|nr:hypothetical protein [Candidatus Omnitrophota bacterium]